MEVSVMVADDRARLQFVFGTAVRALCRTGFCDI
jgi:hypothetical protein